jgi:hypothetical protein
MGRGENKPNFLSFVFYFSWKSNFNQGHNGLFACKQHVSRAGARLCVKQYHLLYKLYNGAAS